MHLSKKPKKTFCNFMAFLISTLNFEHFEKTREFQSLYISEINGCKRRGYLNA